MKSASSLPAPGEPSAINTTGGPPRKYIFFPLSHVVAHVSHCLGPARVLRSRGHEVVFAADDTAHPRSQMGLVEREGFRIVHAKEPDHAYVWTRFMKGNWFSLYKDFSNLRPWVPLEEILESQIQVIKEEEPDAVVGAASVSVSTAAHIARVPAALIFNAYLIDFVVSKLALRYYWNGYERFQLAPRRKQVYRKYGVKPVRAIDLFRSVPLLSPDLPGLYETCRYLRNAHMVGPMPFDFPTPLPSWFDELDDGTPNVYITMGSTGRFDTFLRKTYPILERLPYRFVVTTGGQVGGETIRSAPKNVRITEFAPGTELLRHCSAMVFHGGNGSMYQALSAGVPMVAVPTHFEQTLNTRIAVRNGFCIKLSQAAACTPRLAQAIRSLTEKPTYVEAAQRLAPRVRAMDGSVCAADWIERVAAEAIPAGAALR